MSGSHHLRRGAFALLLVCSPALWTHSFAADAKADADKTKKKEPGRTSNRGPENPDLKFKLPPPKVLTPAEELKTIKVAEGLSCRTASPASR